MTQSTIAGIAISRRLITYAIFTGLSLQHTGSRELASSIEQAASTVVGCTAWLREQFAISAVALMHSGKPDSRSSQLERQATDAALAVGIPPWQVDCGALLDSFAHPPLRSKSQLRDVVRGIWPSLDERNRPPAILDAVAAALYAQVERLFNAARESEQP